MIVKNAPLLKQMSRRPCELCGAVEGTAAHHLWTRGMGGGGRLDVPLNLITLCWACHRKHHDGHIRRDLLVKTVAWRESTNPEALEAEIHRLRRLPRWPKD